MGGTETKADRYTPPDELWVLVVSGMALLLVTMLRGGGVRFRNFNVL